MPSIDLRPTAMNSAKRRARASGGRREFGALCDAQPDRARAEHVLHRQPEPEIDTERENAQELGEARP
jgi:hypothetical protein